MGFFGKEDRGFEQLWSCWVERGVDSGRVHRGGSPERLGGFSACFDPITSRHLWFFYKDSGSPQRASIVLPRLPPVRFRSLSPLPPRLGVHDGSSATVSSPSFDCRRLPRLVHLQSRASRPKPRAFGQEGRIRFLWPRCSVHPEARFPLCFLWVPSRPSIPACLFEVFTRPRLFVPPRSS